MYTGNGKRKKRADIPLAAEEETIYKSRLDGTLTETSLRPRLIDLFAGAGGMTLGFTRFCGHQFEPVWANDFNSYAACTYNANFGEHCVVGDIVDILEKQEHKIPRADVVIGGPPCQGFSLLNKNREDDPRKQLWRPFMDVVDRTHYMAIPDEGMNRFDLHLSDIRLFAGGDYESKSYDRR